MYGLTCAVSPKNLKMAWESSHRCTKEDWLEWMRRLGVELLAHSSSSALRSCHQLALVQPNMARELFSVGVFCVLRIFVLVLLSPLSMSILALCTPNI